VRRAAWEELTTNDAGRREYKWCASTPPQSLTRRVDRPPARSLTTVSEDEEARSQSQAKEAGAEEEETAVGWQS